MKLLTFLFLILCGLIFFLPVGDTDFGWHLRCGQDLINGQPCLTNTYSYYLAGYKFAYPSFLYDAAVAVVFARFGFLGLSLVGSILFAALGFVILLGSKLPFWLTVAGFLAATALSWSVLDLGLRPQVLTVLFVLLTIGLLVIPDATIRNPVNINRSYWFPTRAWRLAGMTTLFIIWTNTHSGFFLGPALVGLWALAAVLERFIQFDGQNLIFTIPSNRAWIPAFAGMTTLVVASIVVTWLNPFGPSVWLELWHHFRTPLNTLIAEWTAPEWWHWVLIIALDGLFVWRSLKTKWSSCLPAGRWFSVLVMTFMTVLALSARRNLPLYYFSYLLTSSPVSFRTNATCRSGIQKLLCGVTGSPACRQARQIAASGMTILLVGLLLWWRVPQTLAADTTWSTYCGQKYPCAAVSFLKTLPPGNTFANYEWGGFLIWQLPSFPVFVDGRTPAWEAPNGESPYTTYLKVIQAQQGWDTTLDLYKTNYLLISQGSFLDLLLQMPGVAARHGYKELYRDTLAVVYQRL